MVESARRWLVGIGAFLIALSGWADVLPPTAELVGVRAAGMGDAYVAIAAGAAGHFHNPAGLGVGRGVHVFGQTNPNHRDEIRLDPKGISYRWRGTGLAWGNRILILPDAISDYSYWSVGRRLSTFVSFGVSGKFYRVHPSEHFQVFGRLPTYDFGIFAAPTADWRMGVRASTVRHGEGVEALAVGTAFSAASHIFSLESEWRKDAGVRVRFGAEKTFFRMMALRLGWRENMPSAGLGFRLPQTALDAAWTRRNGESLLFIGAELDLGAESELGKE